MGNYEQITGLLTCVKFLPAERMPGSGERLHHADMFIVWGVLHTILFGGVVRVLKCEYAFLVSFYVRSNH